MTSSSAIVRIATSTRGCGFTIRNRVSLALSYLKAALFIMFGERLYLFVPHSSNATTNNAVKEALDDVINSSMPTNYGDNDGNHE